MVRVEDRLLRIDRNLISNLRWSLDIMATQAEAAAQLGTVLSALDKIGTETTQLLSDIQALQAAASDATPELQSAIEAVAARAQAIDDMVPDTSGTPAPPPAG
jgi:hypothetical protein